MSPARASVARKRFGQHFLHDPAVIARIVAAIELQPGDAAVEIGPGQGALTSGCWRRPERLDAVEIDRDLAAVLRARFAAEPRFVLHQADALKLDWRALARERGARLRVIGNLPYNISTPLLFRLLESADAILDMHFMLQREVVDRIVAAPGGASLRTADGDAGAARERHAGARCGCRRLPPRAKGRLERGAAGACIDAPPAWSQPPLYARDRRRSFQSAAQDAAQFPAPYLTADADCSARHRPRCARRDADAGAIRRCWRRRPPLCVAGATAQAVPLSRPMPAYRRILAAIDLTEDSRAVADRALEMAHGGRRRAATAARGGAGADGADERHRWCR